MTEEKGWLEKNIDELLALIVVGGSVGVIGYQAIMQSTITMPLEPAMIIIGYLFGRKA